MAEPAELIAAIRERGEAYASFVEGLTAEEFHYRPAPDDWTAAELTGHVAEFPVTFAERSEQIAATPGLTVGRAETDPGRLAAVARLAGAGPAEAAREVRAGVERAAEILSRLPPAAWQATATHRTQGTRTVEQMVEAFIANHLREHLAQARRTIEAARQAQPGS